MAKIERKDKPLKRVQIRTLEGGTLVKSNEAIYVVLQYKDNAAQIGAVNLETGGYLLPDSYVEILPIGKTITLLTA